MSKYRIVEKKYSNGDVEYVCQMRFMFFWFSMNRLPESESAATFGSFDEAKEFLNNLKYVESENVIFKC